MRSRKKNAMKMSHLVGNCIRNCDADRASDVVNSLKHLSSVLQRLIGTASHCLSIAALATSPGKERSTLWINVEFFILPDFTTLVRSGTTQAAHSFPIIESLSRNRLWLQCTAITLLRYQMLYASNLSLLRQVLNAYKLTWHYGQPSGWSSSNSACYPMNIPHAHLTCTPHIVRPFYVYAVCSLTLSLD